jgi:hypothetical protein
VDSIQIEMVNDPCVQFDHTFTLLRPIEDFKLLIIFRSNFDLPQLIYSDHSQNID